jgi:predicted DNA-binding transcriptional regulator AlpA
MQILTPAVLRPRDAAAYLGIGLSTIWRWAQRDAGFPRPHKLASRVTVWRKSDLDDFLERQAGDAAAAEGVCHD